MTTNPSVKVQAMVLGRIRDWWPTLLTLESIYDKSLATSALFFAAYTYASSCSALANLADHGGQRCNLMGDIGVRNCIEPKKTMLGLDNDYKHHIMVVRTTETDLIDAASRCDVTAVKLFLARGVAADSKSESGWTALMLASKLGCSEAVQVLLSKKANVNAKTTLGVTPLRLAAESGQRQIVELLLNGGANVNATTNNGLTSLMVASVMGHRDVVRLLLGRGANANARGPLGITALMLASGKGDPKVVKLLLDKGADVNARLINGQTALTEASRRGHRDVVQLLLKRGATPMPKP